MIGLDRLKLNNIMAKSVNINKILAFGDITVNTKGAGYKTVDINTGEIIYVEDLKLNIAGAGLSENCEAMQIQINKNGALREWKISIGVNVVKLLYGSNEKNLSEESEIEAIPKLIEKTCKMHGLEIDLTTATLSSFEVNVNIIGNQFYNTMKILNEAWKNEGNKVFLTDTKEGVESMKLKLPTREIKIYKKDIQLQDMGHVCTTKDITRIEVSTSHTKTIKQTFFTNNFLDILENMELIRRFYKNSIRNNIKKPFEAYCKNSINEMFDLLESGVKPSDMLMQVGINRVIDLDLYKQAIVKHYKASNKKNPYTMINNNIKKISNAQQYMGNIKKLENFFEYIGL